MSTIKSKTRVLMWIGCFLAVLLVVAVAVGLAKPTGGMTGQLVAERKISGLQTLDFHGVKVSVVANGPRNERAPQDYTVEVDSDGKFNLNHLPTGEYSLTVASQLFASITSHSVFIDEGRVTTVPNITITPMESSVNVASNVWTFTAKQQPHFWIDGTGVDKAEIKIYRVNMLPVFSKNTSGNLVEFNSDSSLIRPTFPLDEISPISSKTPVKTIERDVKPDETGSTHSDFKLNTPLPQGDYLVQAKVKNSFTGTKAFNVTWFNVTNLGLIVKQAPERTVVRAVDLTTLQSVPNVALHFINQHTQSPLVSTVKTGPDGMAEIRGLKDLKSQSVLAYGEHGVDHAYGFLNISRTNLNGYKTYFYTERPIYRLGQTVYYKGISRLQNENGLHTPKAGTKIKATIEDPDNNPLWNGTLTTNAFGSFTGTFPIPKDTKTGGYQMTLTYPDGSDDSETFEVAEYRKPEYSVDVQPITPRVVAGSHAKARIKATYYFGAPVANAKVHYSIYAAADWQARYRLMDRPDYYDFFDSWNKNDSASNDGNGDFITDGYAQTDANGEAVVAFDTKVPAQDAASPGVANSDQRYTIQAEVTDLSRMAVVGSGAMAVTLGDFNLFVTPRQYVYKPGELAQADVRAVDYDGHPITNQTIIASLERWAWDARKDSWRKVDSGQTITLKTDSQGQALAQFKLKQALSTDTYYFNVQAQDKDNHTVRDQNSVWIASAQSPYLLSEPNSEEEAVSIKLDKPVYKAGETVRAMVTAPVTGHEGIQALVSVEGAKLYDVKLVPLDATAKLIEIPIKAEYLPNVYISVTFVGPKEQFYTASQVIQVSPAQRFLNVAVNTDKPKYHPGDTVHYTVKVTRADGKPAANVELSLGVVDESIYAIRAEVAEDIRKFFYDKHDNWVITLATFGQQNSAGPDKMEPRIRKDFRDMAAWKPDLVTDANGIATTAVKLPDNLTTWRATVRGVDKDTNVGSSIQKIISAQDLMVRLGLPRFFTQGDSAFLTAVVHNYTNQVQHVHLNLTASKQFAVHRNTQQDLTVKPDDAQRYSWPVDIQGLGPAKVLVKAIGQTASDAIEQTVPINPLGVAVFDDQSGILSQNPSQINIPLTIPSGVSSQTVHYQLGLAPSALGPALGSFATLIDYPYGCTEQTMSRLYPSIIAMRLHQKWGLPLSQADQVKFQKVFEKSMTLLRSLRHGDGGWGWWPTDESNPQITAIVMTGFDLLQKAGYHVDSWLIKDGRQWVKNTIPVLYKQLQDPKLLRTTAWNRLTIVDARINLARLVYVSSLYRDAVPKAVEDYLMASRSDASPEQLAFTMLALHNRHRDAEAGKTQDALLALANHNDGTINWSHSRELLARMHFKSAFGDYTYSYTGVETTALALEALTATLPAKPNAEQLNRLDAVTRWLLTQHNKDGWDNTKTTAQVLMALTNAETANPLNQHPQFSVALRPLQKSFVFSQANQYKPEVILSPALAALQNQLTLVKNGIGRLYYHSFLTYFKPLHPGEAVPVAALPDGLKIERSFYRLEPSIITKEGLIHFRSVPISNHTVKAGETVLIKIKINSPMALPYVLLECALPSGGEVVMNDPRANLAENDETPTSAQDSISGDWGAFWWSHQDVLDDRIAVFASSVPQGTSEVFTLVRMEMPGSFQMNPIKLQGMYTRNIQAYSALDTLKVIE